MGEWKEDKEYASKGVAGTGLGLGIAGTALALLNNGCGGGLGGLLGGSNCGAIQAQMAASSVANEALSKRDSKIAKLEAEIYTDRQDRATYEMGLKASTELMAAEARRVNTYIEPIAKAVAKLEEKEAVAAVKMAALEKELTLKDEIVALRTDKKICEVVSPLKVELKGLADGLAQLQGQMQAGLQLEAFERKCADDKIVTYVNTTFQPQLIANPAAGTGTYSAPIFNPLCCSGARQAVQTPTAG